MPGPVLRPFRNIWISIFHSRGKWPFENVGPFRTVCCVSAHLITVNSPNSDVLCYDTVAPAKKVWRKADVACSKTVSTRQRHSQKQLVG